jgi:hypothetical protein
MIYHIIYALGILRHNQLSIQTLTSIQKGKINLVVNMNLICDNNDFDEQM